MKFIVIIIAGILSSFGSYAFTDSVAKKNNSAKVISIKKNVVYPALLKNHKDETIAYIEKFATSRRAYLQRTYARGKKYFPKIASIFKKYNLPQELKVLIALESGFNPNAVSSAGAVGYWQIMDPVAKEYGLKIIENTVKQSVGKVLALKNATLPAKTSVAKQVDERKNLNKSTYVAARYLRDRCKNLNNDYLLIVASYNWGVGNVWNAMQKTGKANATFWDIKKYLPAETRAYVMNFIALNVIFHNYESFAKNQLSFSAEDEIAQSRVSVNPGRDFTITMNSLLR